MFSVPLPLPETRLLLTPPWAGLSPAVQAALLLFVCLVPLLLLAWLYRYELHLIPRGTALALLGLRLAVLGLLLFLVCLQPIYARDRTEQLPGRVLVAVDRSASLDVADPQRPVADKLRLARALKLGEGLATDEQLAGWVRDHDEKRSPRWVTEDEARDDPARRQQLEEERRHAHDEVCQRVDALTRSETARLVLGGDAVRLLARLAEKHQVELIGFHSKAWEQKPDRLDELFRKPGEDKTTDAQEWDGSAYTDLRVPLLEALERSAPGQGRVLGVVVLTDGQHNAGDPPTRKAQELGERRVHVYPLALGARTAPPDVAVVGVKAPTSVFKDVEAAVDVRFKISGLPAGEFTVEVFRDGKEKKLLAQRTVKHDGKDRDYTETFPLRMDEVGTPTLLARVRPNNPEVKETRADNNSRSTTLNVADDRAKVLLVDGEARWEYHYLATALARDRTIQLERVVFNQPRLDDRLTPEQLEKMGSPRQKLPEGPDALAGFDCIILGDVAAEQLPLPERKRLERYVADRGGTLVLLAGKRAMPLAYPEAEANGESDPLRRLLPIDNPRVAAPLEGFPVTLSQAGQETKFMELDPELGKSAERWAKLPKHFWGVIGQAKPGAVPLAYLADRAAAAVKADERERQNGLIVRHNYGFGRVLFVGLDSTWRWRFRKGDVYHHRFWGQAIRWAASDKPLVTGNEHVRFGTPQPVYHQGQEVEVLARLGEGVGALRPDLLAGARILKQEAPGKDTAVALVPLGRRAAQPRVLEGKVRDLAPGRYEIELAIPDLADRLRGGAESKPLRAAFTVLPPESREMVDLETRWPLLQEIAAKSGGRVFTPENASELAELLTNQSVPHVEHREQRLWQWWGMLALLVALLTLEWAGRKWAGLP